MTEILDKLRDFDEIDAYESPSQGIAELPGNVRRFQATLREKFDLDLKLSVMQDAAFYAYLSSRGDSGKRLHIRFSNFGRLATIILRDDSRPDLHEMLVNLLEEYGFIYVPLEILDLAYTGPNKDFSKIVGKENPTWWDRYFNYI